MAVLRTLTPLLITEKYLFLTEFSDLHLVGVTFRRWPLRYLPSDSPFHFVDRQAAVLLVWTRVHV
jgi:hypothetical protein